jgi:hypothetical protein
VVGQTCAERGVESGRDDSRLDGSRDALHSPAVALRAASRSAAFSGRTS